MDFAAQLAKLERTAARAAASRNDGGDRRRGRSPNASNSGGDHLSRGHNQRPRHNYDSSNRNSHFNNDNRGRQNQQQQHQQRSSRLEAMHRFGYRVDPPAWTPKTERTAPHICLLAVTIDDLPYEHIWKAWTTAGAATFAADATASLPCYVSLVCHAKFPERVTSEWLRQRLLLQPPRIGRGTKYDDPVFHTRIPEWGSVDIARAMTDCLRDAVKIGCGSNDNNNNDVNDKASQDDPRFEAARFVVARPNTSSGTDDTSSTTSDNTVVPTVDKFIFISETCLPVTTLKECVDALFFPPATTSTTAKPTAVKAGNGDEKEDAIGVDDDDSKVAAGATAKDAGSATLTTTTAKDADRDDDVPPKEPPTVIGHDSAAATSAVVDPWDVSWVNARNRNTPGTPKNMYERDQFSDIHRMVNGMYRWKADQWLVLSRRHALAVLHIDGHMMKTPADQLWNAFANINASDEMYFPTALAVLGILQEDNVVVVDSSAGKQPQDSDREKTQIRAVAASAVAKRAVTYTDWTEGMRNPATFVGGPRDLAKVAALARKQGCLFARKFALQGPLEGSHVTGQITVHDWNEVIATRGTQK